MLLFRKSDFLQSRIVTRRFFFLWIKLFLLFFKIESWNFQVQFEIRIRETSQNFNSFSFSSFFVGSLIELKFCKFSQNSISIWTLKFLEKQKVLFLKTKKLCLLTQFSQGLGCDCQDSNTMQMFFLWRQLFSKKSVEKTYDEGKEFL